MLLVAVPLGITKSVLIHIDWLAGAFNKNE